MKRIISIILYAICISATAQNWSVSTTLTQTVNIASMEARPMLTAGIHRSCDYRFSLSLYTTITKTTATDLNDGSALLVAVVPALTTYIYDRRKTSISIDTGIGIGHTFTTKQTDHNHHSYLLALTYSYHATSVVSIIVRPSITFRDWQGHVGYNKEYARASVMIGAAYRLPF